MMEKLQSTVAGSRVRFVVSLAVLCVAFFLAFAGWLRVCQIMQWGITPRFVGFAVLAAILVFFYGLRCRHIGLNPAWALAGLVPLANIALPIFLTVKERPARAS